MKHMLWASAAVALLAAGTVGAQDIVFKPIDTNRLVVKPSQTAAGIAARTIDLVGRTTAGSLENNGYVKTLNNLFSKKVIVPTTQNGPSALPSPNMFPSTQYKNYNTPVMPTVQQRRR
jgi:hypothetical protein